MKQNNRIRDSLNENLSGLYVSRQQHAMLMNEITGGRKMKKKLSTSFILVMILILLAAVALAWGLSYSGEVTVTRTARNAIMDKYGLSRNAIDMFWPKIESGDEGTTVSFTAHDVFGENLAKAGIYTATIAKDGSVSVHWTHDDVDPAAWASGSLDDEVWGAEQILAYRAKREQENRSWAERGNAGEYGDNEILTRAITPPPALQGKLTEAQALDIAQATMKETFGFTDETLALFDVSAGLGEREYQAVDIVMATLKMKYEISDELRKLLESYAELHEQEGGRWVVFYHPTYLTSTVLSTGENTPLGGYVVTVSDETGMALQTKWSLEGKDEKTYTEHTWGQASAYSAKMLPWFMKLMDACVPLLMTEDGAIEGMPTGFKDKAIYDQVFRDAGFDKTKYNHVLPQPGDIPYEKAVDIVAQVLLEECDVSRAVFDASGFAYADLEQMEDHREWYFWVQNAEEQCSWTVVFNAETGEILYVVADPMANSNG